MSKREGYSVARGLERLGYAASDIDGGRPRRKFSALPGLFPRHRRDLGTTACYGLLVITGERQGSCVSDRRPHEVRS